MTATYIHSGPQKVIWRDVIEFASTEKCRCQEWRGGYGYGGTLKSVPTAVAIPIANVPQRVKICKLPLETPVAPRMRFRGAFADWINRR